MIDRIERKIQQLKSQIENWDNSNVSACLAPWHDGIGRDDHKTPYTLAKEELIYLERLIKE